jgi:4-hydroxybenzoate polyprenyltransferase
VNGSAAKPSALSSLRELLDMIKFQHSLFALPFAFTGMFAAARGLPSMTVFLLIVACMVTARTAGMTFNRVVDRRFDADNPRTSDRALPAGRVGSRAAVILLVLSAVGFVAACAALNRATLLLAPFALAVTLGYSLTKRITWATHFVLGLSLSIAPIGAFIGVTGRMEARVLPLGLAVLLWTAGFDLLYSCQDAEHDRRVGLHSVPARFGIKAALLTARLLHAGAALALAWAGVSLELGLPYALAVIAAAGVMGWSHSLVRADDLSRVGVAFFQANVTVSVLVLLGTIAAVFTSPA